MGFNEARKIKAQRLKVQANIKAAVTIMGNDALNHFKSSFTNQGFTDEGLSKWKPRKRSKRRGKSDSSRAILVKSGTLKRSLIKESTGLHSVKITTNVPYAIFHNEGGVMYRKPFKRTATRSVRIRGAYRSLGDERGRGKKVKIMGKRHNVSATSYKLPKRQFVGHSRKLIDNLRNKLNNKIKDAFK